MEHHGTKLQTRRCQEITINRLIVRLYNCDSLDIPQFPPLQIHPENFKLLEASVLELRKSLHDMVDLGIPMASP